MNRRTAFTLLGTAALLLPVVLGGCVWAMDDDTFASDKNMARGYTFLDTGTVTTVDGKKYRGDWRVSNSTGSYERISPGLPRVVNRNFYNEHVAAYGSYPWKKWYEAPVDLSIPAARVAGFAK